VPVITYIAKDRGELVPGHVAGGQYQIETELQAFPRRTIANRNDAETLDGTPESWLDSLQREWSVRTDIILAANIDVWREFISSVLNRETFQIAFTGTIANPGPSINVTLVSDSVEEEQLGGVAYQLSFIVKALP